jgi:hypothetical protein
MFNASTTTEGTAMQMKRIDRAPVVGETVYLLGHFEAYRVTQVFTSVVFVEGTDTGETLKEHLSQVYVQVSD